jgi:hypothetical protein
MKYDTSPNVQKISRNPAGMAAARARITSHVLRSLPENPVSRPITTRTANAATYGTAMSRRLSSSQADHCGDSNNLTEIGFAFLV